MGGKDKKRDKKALLAGKAVMFQEGGLFYFVLKKSERLVAALYLVTDLFPDGDPLRQKMRVLGLDILSFTARTASTRDITSANNNGLAMLINEIRTLLNVALAVRMLSPMNHRMLDSEYSALLRVIKENAGRLEENAFGSFEKSFFDIDGALPERVGASQEEVLNGGITWGREVWDGIYKGHDIGHPNDVCPIETEGSPRTFSSPIRKGSGISMAGYSRKMSGNPKAIRRSAVIDLVRKKGVVSIKDISDAIKDCGAKTLQRELVSLVGEGVLKKEGERRWSTYTLAS